MARLTPVLHSKGIFKLRSPWSISDSSIYECIAVRSIADFVDRGVDVVSKVYVPVGKGQAEANADIDAGAMIVTLISPGKSPVYVPDTYIVPAPAQDGIPYSHTLLSVSLGAVPDGMSMEWVKDLIATAVEQGFGIRPTVLVHVAPTTGYVSQAQHEINETARNAAITNRTTDRTRVIELQNVVDQQKIQIQNLENIIKQLSPPPGP